MALFQLDLMSDKEGKRSDGSIGIIKRNPYRVFTSKGEPRVYLQSNTFCYEDGTVVNPGEAGVDLPDYVKLGLPTNYWAQRAYEALAPVQKLSTDELIAELASRKAAQDDEAIDEDPDINAPADGTEE